ncbi:MAG: pyridoxal-phosphate dependent enzyme, partial [Chitinophagales bacterium]|nr:pyridoxal-phosphate dependent enzyme [Chitinophagales bacterium]
MDIELNKSPIQKIEDSLLLQKGVSLYIKRDDLIHPLVQGNKWRKLKYNLLNAREEGQHTLVTFGGYYSNHIYATAAAAKLFNFKAIGIIRGEEPVVKSETLQFALAQGMQLVYVERATYDRKEDDSFIGELKMRYGPFYYVPEGGTNLLALKGVSEIINEIEIDFDVICTACGTGGTLAGLVAGLHGQKQALG